MLPKPCGCRRAAIIACCALRARWPTSMAPTRSAGCIWPKPCPTARSRKMPGARPEPFDARGRLLRRATMRRRSSASATGTASSWPPRSEFPELHRAGSNRSVVNFALTLLSARSLQAASPQALCNVKPPSSPTGRGRGETGSGVIGMGQLFRIKLRIRRFTRKHPWLTFASRSFVIFSAAFGGAYGFFTGSKAENSGYDPHAFAMGASFLFAIACVALATLSFRLRWMRQKLRKIALHNEALADRNWELQEAEQRARSLFESQGDLVVLRNLEGTLTFANDAYCELAERPQSALVGSKFTFNVLEQGKTALLADGTTIQDQKIASPLGARWIAWREGLVRSDAGQPAEMRCVGRDVPDRTEAERALTEARDQAQAANRAKSRFLAMASHEIRTPLNGIVGMTGLLLETPLTQEQMTYAKAANTSGHALVALIEELLDYSKIEAGKIDLENRPFALAALIEDIAELLAPRAQARKLEIAAFVDERLPMEGVGDV